MKLNARLSIGGINNISWVNLASSTHSLDEEILNLRRLNTPQKYSTLNWIKTLPPAIFKQHFSSHLQKI